MTPRRATATDLDAIVDMGDRFFAQTDYGQNTGHTPESVRSFASMLMDRPDAIVLVYERDGTVAGMLAGHVYRHPFSGLMVASELAWWVNPDERGTAGLKLLATFETWAKEQRAEMIQVVAPEGTRVGTIYAHRHYAPVETMYQRRVA